MASPDSSSLTQILRQAAEGNERAAADLLPLVYNELQGLARRYLSRTPPGNTLQPTALVHEAYLRLIGPVDEGWNSRGHFFCAAAQAMRQILVEQARRKGAVKHGGGHKRVGMEHADIAIDPPVEDLLALDEALVELEKADPRKSRIVMLRYFAGLTAAETAEALEVSIPTIEREWRFIRPFLYTRLKSSEVDE